MDARQKGNETTQRGRRRQFRSRRRRRRLHNRSSSTQLGLTEVLCHNTWQREMPTCVLLAKIYAVFTFCHFTEKAHQLKSPLASWIKLQLFRYNCSYSAIHNGAQSNSYNKDINPNTIVVTVWGKFKLVYGAFVHAFCTNLRRCLFRNGVVWSTRTFLFELWLGNLADILNRHP